MANKILDAAAEYCRMNAGKTATDGRTDVSGIINDAANIYAGSYDEYLMIWAALEKLFM